MADVKPTSEQATKAKQPGKPAPAVAKQATKPASALDDKKADANLTPQELEARKATEDAKAEEERQAKIQELIKSKKYFLPIK